MKIYKKIIFLVTISLLGLGSCDNGFDEMNTNPNNPEMVPTYTLFNSSTKRLIDTSRDGWTSGRMLLPWVQYSSQHNATDEDKYLFRPPLGQRVWENIYHSISGFKIIIDLCTDPKTSVLMNEYGDLDSQIAVSRIMLAYSFAELANYFGDVPYWSYSGRDNTAFQALDVLKYSKPTYLPQKELYVDILKELKEAEEQIKTTNRVFMSDRKVSGDKIYGGDVLLWKKFANSLRLRIANQIKEVYPEADQHIQSAILKGVFTSNDDNAGQNYGNSNSEGSPFWATFFVSNRTDFFINNQFVKLLKGESGSYGKDPRLKKFIAPIGVTKEVAASGEYQETDDYTKYQGMPYALPDNRLIANNSFAKLSVYSKYIFKPTFKEILMEYSEVEFILSEINQWSQDNYERGVRASMLKWGVEADEVNNFISELPVANKENVSIQKYIALFMQPQNAWVEYRRTGYPDGKVLLLPGQTGYELDGTPYVFVPRTPGIITLPSRISYPDGEQRLNKNNWLSAIEKYGGNDIITGKLWWMP